MPYLGTNPRELSQHSPRGLWKPTCPAAQPRSPYVQIQGNSRLQAPFCEMEKPIWSPGGQPQGVLYLLRRPGGPSLHHAGSGPTKSVAHSTVPTSPHLSPYTFSLLPRLRGSPCPQKVSTAALVVGWGFFLRPDY